jgi:hypothetical protein
MILRIVVTMAIVLGLILTLGACTKTVYVAPTSTTAPMQNLRERFVSGFIATHNSMADADKLQPEAADAATGGLYTAAVEKMTEADMDAQKAFISIPSDVLSEMQKQNTGVSEGKVVDLLSARITSFMDGAEHFLKAMRYVQQGDVSGHNQEADLANAAFAKSWQSEYALQDLVKTDANLSYLRQAVGW